MAKLVSKEATELFTAEEVVEPEETVDLSNLVDSESVEVENPFIDEKESTNSVDDEITKLLMDQEIDVEEQVERQQSLYLETGLYRFVEGKCDLRTNYNDEDKRDTDVAQKMFRLTKDTRFNKGRCYHQVSGMVENVKTNKRGRFQFSISPDKRVVNEENDFATKNYALVEQYFFQKYERNPKTQGEVRELLASAMYALYISRGKNGGNFFNKMQKLP